MKKIIYTEAHKTYTQTHTHTHIVLALKLCIDQRCTSVIIAPSVQKSCRNPASSHGTRCQGTALLHCALRALSGCCPKPSTRLKKIERSERS